MPPYLDAPFPHLVGVLLRLGPFERGSQRTAAIVSGAEIQPVRRMSNRRLTGDPWWATSSLLSAAADGRRRVRVGRAMRPGRRDQPEGRRGEA